MAAPDNDAFHQALLWIGFTNLAANEIIDQGLGDTLTLLLLTPSDVKLMCKVIRDGGIVIPFMVQQHLQMMHYWANKMSRMCMPIDANMFTLAAAEVYGQKMIAEDAEKDADVDVKAPDKFIVGSKWNIFKEGFETMHIYAPCTPMCTVFVLIVFM
jgi:hypothetical protein